MLEGRVRQINAGVHWAKEPVSRFVHIITNIEVTRDGGDEVEVASRFFVYQNGLADEVNHFVGRRNDLLRHDADTDFRIAKRTILLAQDALLPKVMNTFF